MPKLFPARLIFLMLLAGGLAACSGGGNTFQLGGNYDPAGVVKSNDPLAEARASVFNGPGATGENPFVEAASDQVQNATTVAANRAASGGTIWDNFTQQSNPNTTVQVNKYIWKAALEVLNFLPVESVDPFTGVIVTGFGTPPGSNKAYRATIYVQDGALDARSLNLALQTRGGGPVAADTALAVEDAILNRARQLRIADAGY